MSTVPLNSSGPLSGISGEQANILTVNKNGIYLINYGFTGKSSASTSLTVEVVQNSNPVASSSLIRDVTANSIEAFSGSVIAMLSAGDEINLGIEATDSATVTPSSGTNAYLTISQLA